MSTQFKKNNTFNLLGMKLTVLDIDDVWGIVRRGVLTRGVHGYLIFANVHLTVETTRSTTYREAVKGSAMTLPDSTPLFWIAKSKGFKIQARVYGPDFMRHALERSRDGSVRHFFYGGNQAVLDCLLLKIRAEYPGVSIAGFLAPPFRDLTEAEMVRDVDTINSTYPDIVWVGLGCPKQELWMSAQKNRVHAAWMAGVGQAFNQISGMQFPAPRWMQNSGLEWFYRLCREPRRLAPRYLMTNFLFIWYLLLEALRFKRFSS